MKTWKLRPWYAMMGSTLLIFGFNLYRTATHQNIISKDFALYAKFMVPIKLHGIITTPHFIYPLLVAAASIVVPGVSYIAIGMGIVLVFQLLAATILWDFWEKVLPDTAKWWASIALTLACMVVAPVNLFTPGHDYFGYIGITVYHNPPMLISRPIVLLHFLIFAGAISSGAIRTWQTALCAAAIILATLMKPNYALIIVPTAGLLALWAMTRKEYRLFNFITIGTLLPAIAVLIWQYYFTYVSENTLLGESHIILKPFFVYSDRSGFVFPKFILSILFPLGVLLACWMQAVRDRFYLVGFMLFLFGAAQSYLLAESGSRLYDGNFLWSAQIGLFLWFIASIRLVLRRFFSDAEPPRPTPAFVTLSVLFALHLISGFIWYAHETIAPGAFW